MIIKKGSASVNNAMKSVRIARKIDRPNTREFIDKLFENFMEMHGDRLFADDGSIVGGIASFEGTPVTVIGIQLQAGIVCLSGM